MASWRGNNYHKKINQRNKIDEKLINRDELVIDVLQAINVLVPSEIVPAPESLILYLYELKKKIIELDPNWKFMNPHNDYIFRILILLDALDISVAFNLEEHRKICHLICRETRDIRRINSLWKMNTTSIVEFLNLTS